MRFYNVGVTITTGVLELSKNPQNLELVKPMIEKIPMKRMANADEVATAVILFVTGIGSYCTGSSLVVDGGLLLK
jgi:NAD(P)-dependent dehydrogenase (short-subunit alcohol dehydrogenase family)